MAIPEQVPAGAKNSAGVTPDYELVPGELRQHVMGQVEALLKDDGMTVVVRRILSEDPEQREIDINALLNLDVADPARSIAVATLLEGVIENRWKQRAYVLHCDPKTVDLRSFDEAEQVQYEYMPTKVLPDAVPGGIGKLLITFPRGAEEAEKAHRHPGGRVIVSTGPGRFNCPDVPGGVLQLKAGDVVLMPKGQLHNFAANGDQDWKALSFHVGYAGTGPEAIQFERE